MRRKLPFIVLLIISYTIIISCNLFKDDNTNDRIILNNDAQQLSGRINLTDEIIELKSLDNSFHKATAAPTGFQLIQRAEVNSFVHNGFTMRVSHVSIHNDMAYITYNREGEAYLGGIEIYDVSDISNPTLVSQAIFIDTDFSCSVYDDNKLYLAGAQDGYLNPDLNTPAILEKIHLGAGGELTTNSEKKDVSSYVATDIEVKDGIIYATTGDGGHILELNESDMTLLDSSSIFDARGVAICEEYVAVLAASPMRLYVESFSNPGVVNEYPITSQTIPESKSTITMDNCGYAYVTLNDGGLKVIRLSDGVIMQSIPRPETAPGGDDIDYVTNGVSVNGSLVFISNGAAGVYVGKKFTNSNLIELWGSLDFHSSTNFAVNEGNIVFVATGLGGFRILEIVGFENVDIDCDGDSGDDNEFTIAATSGLNGTINPLGSVVIAENGDTSFVFNPDTGYEVDSVIVDNIYIGSPSSYDFTDITADHSIYVTFKPISHTITATKEGNGYISPHGAISVNEGGDMSFNIVAGTGHKISDVIVDGVSQGAINFYEFSSVNNDHTIHVTFIPLTFSINATSGPNGSITPAGNTIVDYNNDQSFTFTPVPGFEVDQVSVDSSAVDSLDSYKFKHVTDNHSIHVTFKQIVVNHTISASAGSGGEISPAGDITVANGGNQSFTITPTTGYNIADVTVDGTSVGTPSSYDFTGITGDHTIHATFSELTHTITATSGPNGNITPSGNVVVSHIGDQSFSFTPDPGFEIDDVRVDGVSVGDSTSYGFNNVTEDHTINVTFKQRKYTIHASAAPFGSITPVGDIVLAYNANQSFTMTPIDGYKILDVVVDGESVGTGSLYEFTHVNDDHSIHVEFGPITHVISATSNAGGTISPRGNLTVLQHNDLTFTITPDEGYEIDFVLIDGIDVGPVASFDFNDVTNDHTIYAQFKLITHVISASADPNGKISPYANVIVEENEDQLFAITPNPGYEIKDVVVDGISVGAVSSYEFTNVTEDHIIHAEFNAIGHLIIATSSPNGGITPAGHITVYHGGDTTFHFVPSPDYEIDDVTVDGISIGSPISYDFLNVTADHTINVSFKPAKEDLHVLIIDSETIDPGISTIEDAGNDHGVNGNWLINEHKKSEGTNYWFEWNKYYSGDQLWLPTGQDGDEGLFKLPSNIPWDLEDLIEGNVNQSNLDKIADVEPLNNLDLSMLIGKKVLAICHVGDVGMNYSPTEANLQGERYGLFAFTVDAIRNGNLPESSSSSSLKDIQITVLDDFDWTQYNLVIGDL